MEVAISNQTLICAYILIHILFAVITHHRFITIARLYNETPNDGRASSGWAVSRLVTNTDLVALFAYRILVGLPNLFVICLIGIIWAIVYLVGYALANTLILVATREHLTWKNRFLCKDWYIIAQQPREVAGNAQLIIGIATISGIAWLMILLLLA